MAQNEDNPEDIEQILREERARGTKARIPDADAIKERQLQRQTIYDLFEINDRDLFLKVLIDDYGMEKGSPQYIAALEAWDENQKKKPSGLWRPSRARRP